MRISDWSSDVCSSDLAGFLALPEEVLEEVVQHVAVSVELQAVSYTHLDVYKRQL